MEKRKAGTTPEGEIWLLDCSELSSDYSNTWYFDNPAQQQQYFKSKLVHQYHEPLKKYSYLRKEQAIKVNAHIDDLHSVNYIMYCNRADEYVYAFVIEKEYINDATTKIYIKTDLIQTYFFNFKLIDSYIDRCHVDRWTKGGQPTEEFEPEDIEFGEYIQESTQDIYTFKDSYIAVCSNPLGKIDTRPKKPDDPSSGGSKGDWENGIISADGFRFIKGFEAFAPIHYLDTLAVPPVNTICYGVTEHGEKAIYDDLVKKEPVTEEEGAKISYDLKNNNYGKRIVDVCKRNGITKQNQFDALVSLAYNAGTGAVTDGGSLIQLIKKDPNDCVAIKKKWETYYNASQLEGVRLRRIEESKMFCGEPYDIRKISIVDPMGKPTGKYVETNNGNGWLPS